MTDHIIPTMPEILAMSGIEHLQRILSGDLSGPPIGDLLRYRLTMVDDGVVAFEGTPGPEHCNPTGGVHGGWYGTLLDSCMSCAVWSRIPKGRFYTTLEYKVNLIRAIPQGTPIVATGWADHVGRSTGTGHGEIRGKADGRLFATGTVTCLILSPEP